MFLTKQHFEESLRIMQTYENMDDEGIKMAVAADFAKELFPNFESMKESERKDVISMILEDLSVSIYSIN